MDQAESVTSHSTEKSGRQWFEVKIAHELLDAIEMHARTKMGERAMSIPPEAALILIEVYREHLWRLGDRSDEKPAMEGA